MARVVHYSILASSRVRARRYSLPEKNVVDKGRNPLGSSATPVRGSWAAAPEVCRPTRIRTCSSSVPECAHSACTHLLRCRPTRLREETLHGDPRRTHRHRQCRTYRALTGLITDPRFELTGVWVSSDAKVGKDAGELAGLDASTGITATNDLDALLATEPDCAVYCAMGDNRMPEAVKDVRRILAARHQRRRHGSGAVAVPVGRHAGQVHRSPRRGCATGQFEPLHHRGGSRVRQRPDPVRAREHLPAHRAGAVHGDRRLRHL